MKNKCIMSTCFFYNEKHYKQVHGKAMGSNFKYVTPGLKSFLRKIWFINGVDNVN